LSIQVTAHGEQSGEELRSLLEWLREDPDLHGRVTPVESPPTAGTLGPALDAIAVALGPGGVATALAAAAVAWIRNRTGDLTLRVRRADDVLIELSAKRVRDMDSANVRALLAEVTTALDDGAPAERPQVP
jgi:hypothetical protein